MLHASLTTLSRLSFLGRATRGILPLMFAGLLTACGGGGGSSSEPTADASAVSLPNASAEGISRYTLTLNKMGQGTVTGGGLNCGSTCSSRLTRGSTVLLHAEPAAGYVAAGWSGAGVNCPSIGDCAITMSTPVTATALFTAVPVTAPTQYELSVSIAGSGAVTSNPSGINCTVGCNAFFAANANVTLTATPVSGYAFSGWSGSGLSCGTAASCVVPMTSARAVTASFAAIPPANVTLSLSLSSGGSVAAADGSLSCSTSACSKTYTSGSSVTLAATPASGYLFTGWSGACSGSGGCTLNLTGSTSVSATFAPIPPTLYAVNVSTTGSGVVTSAPAGISCGAACSTTFASGTSVALTATPSAGYGFSGWSGACSGTGACNIAVSGATAVTANFYKITYPLAVTKQGSGTVTSADAKISCGSACSYSYDAGQTVTLTAAAASGYTFSGWSGACSGTSTCTVTTSAAVNVAATFTLIPVTTSGAPVVLYTDTLTGPTTGGENNLGGYLSVFGKNFGSASGMGTTTKVYIGNTEVANYRYLGNAKVGSKLGMQQITVQVGSLGGAVNGTALPVKVVVNGTSSNTNNTFTPAAGRILFVSLTGNDSTAVYGDITKPWRSLQNMNTVTGAYFSMGTGDHIVIRGGNWSDANGVDSTWMRAGNGIYARYGTASAWIHITAYPGPINGNAIEDVHYTTPAGKTGGFSGPWTSLTYVDPTASSEPASIKTGQYWSISNLRMDVAGGAARDAAPINFQFGIGPWRVVNNELGPWVAGSSTILNAAAISGHGNGNKIIGNHVHDIEGIYTGDQALQNHGIYSDSMSLNWEIAYNWIHDIKGGSLIQFNDNQGCAGADVASSMCGAMPGTNRTGVWTGFTGMRVHHNWMENAAKYGINYNDQGSTQAGGYEGQHWNNVIIGTALPPIRINSTQPSQQLWFAFNTLYNCMTTTSGSGNAYVRSEGFGNGSNVRNTFYNNIMAFGAKTVAGTGWFANVGGINATTSSYDFKRNLYFAGSQAPAAAGSIGDSVAVAADPLFTSAGADFTLTSASPARNQATQALLSGFTVGDDFTALTGRSVGGVADIGAFEAAQ